MRILIVEDEVKIRTGMARLISNHTGHTIVGEAKNGQEGLEMAVRLHPELVITDIRMPVMDGLEMLEELEKREIRCHRVILSGYSEFEYARKAMRFGVEDYLLKPLAADDVTSLLASIEEKLKEEEERSALTTEGLLRTLLLGKNQEKEKLAAKLRKQGGFEEGRPCCLAAGYVGDTNPGYIPRLKERWEEMRKKYPSYRICYMFLDSTQEMFCLIQGEDDGKQMEEKLSRRLYLDLEKEAMPVWTMGYVENFGELSRIGKRLRELYPYGMLTDYREILTAEKAAGLKQGEYQYPKKLEGIFQTAICNGSPDSLRAALKEFQEAMEEMNCSPRLMRHGYIKMVNFVANVCHEVNPAAYKLIQNMDVEKLAADAVTRGELRRCFEREIGIILEFKDRKEDIRNYTIKRAISYIRTHYRENLSLEHLAEYLEITPEYLSTLFNKEVGINFTVFLKRFRISQAKRLLKGTDKKIYEIALEVGYNDPKYFNRVFKEVIGVSPGDYRQLD